MTAAQRHSLASRSSRRARRTPRGTDRPRPGRSGPSPWRPPGEEVCLP